MLPILDTNVIVEAVFDKSCPTASKLFEVIREGGTSLASSIEKKKVEEFPLVCHAEMRILKEVHEVRNDSSAYVGVGMLCCTPCQLMLDIINERNPMKEEKKFSNYGTHGGTYPGWVVTDFFQKELLQKIEKLAAKKTRESTSEVPDYFQMVLQPLK